MANTIATELNVDVLAQEVLPDVADNLALLDRFTTNFTADRKGSVIVEVPKIGTSGLLKNGATFGAEDSDIEAVSVTVDHYSKGFYLTNNELQSGRELTKLFKAKAEEFATGLFGVVTDVMVPANFGTTYSDSISAMEPLDLTTASGSVKGKKSEKVLLLQTEAYSVFEPTNGDMLPLDRPAYGFNEIHDVTDFTGTDVVGFAGTRSSIAIAGGLPKSVADDGVMSTVISTEIGLDVQLDVWYDRNAKAHRADYSCLFGAAKGIAEAGKVFVDPAEDA